MYLSDNQLYRVFTELLNIKVWS